MIPPPGLYHYELRQGSHVLASESCTLTAGSLSGERRAADGDNRHQVEAELDAAGLVRRIRLRYSRGPFSRTAHYESAGDILRGAVSALAGHNAVQVKLGRFRELDGDLVLFKALILGHVQARGEHRWTGRVAVVDPQTLVVASVKQTYRRDRSERQWVFEPRLGERERIELDRQGRIVRRADERGNETVLLDFTPERPE